jgi:predicted RNase H-like nuclease (RuvC/YqgF family)
MKYGRAVLIATDVKQIPKSVKKLASSLNSKIYSPKNDIQVSYKNKIVNDYLNDDNNLNFESTYKLEKNQNIISNEKDIYSTGFDAHGRDSLSAAILAYKSYENKLNQLEKKFFEIEENGYKLKDDDNYNFNYNITEKLDHAKTLLINEVPISIAIDSVLREEINNEIINIDELNNVNDVFIEKNKQDKTNNSNENLSEDLDCSNIEILNNLKIIIKSQEKQIKNQEKLIKNLNSKNKELNNKVNEYNVEITNLKNELKYLNETYSKNLLKEKTIASKVQLLKTIQRKYMEEKKVRKSLEDKLNFRDSFDNFNKAEELTPIKIIDFFTREGINKTSNILEIKKGDVILLNSSEGGGSQTAKILTDFDIKAILTFGAMPQQAEEIFEEENIPIILANDLKIEFFDNFAVISTKILDSEIKKWKDNQKNNMKKKAQKELLEVIGDYKAKRKRSM